LRTAGLAGEQAAAATTPAAAPWRAIRRATRRRSTGAGEEAAATTAAKSTTIGIEDAEQQREEARVRTWLQDHRVAVRLDRLGFAALQRFVGGDRGQRLRVHVRDVFDTGRAGPSRSGAVGHPAGQRESGVRRAVVGEQSLRVRVARGDVILRNE